MPPPKDPKKEAEWRAKISASLKGRKRDPDLVEKTAAANRGRPCSTETRRKISEAHTGRIIDTEWRANLSKAHLGQRPTQEQREKISAALTGRVFTKKHRENISKALAKAREEGRLHFQVESAIAASKRVESSTERLLKVTLRRMRIHYRGHYPVLNRYVADVYLPARNLLLEADGVYHHGQAKWFDPVKQAKRDRAIRKAGFKLQRIPNEKIEADPVAAVHWALQKQRAKQ